MHRVDTDGHLANMFKETPAPPTQVDSAWLNALQEEVANAIEDATAGNTPLVKGTNTQLAGVIVTRAVAQTITGAKTFTNVTIFEGETTCGVLVVGNNFSALGALFERIGPSTFNNNHATIPTITATNAGAGNVVNAVNTGANPTVYAANFGAGNAVNASNSGANPTIGASNSGAGSVIVAANNHATMPTVNADNAGGGPALSVGAGHIAMSGANPAANAALTNLLTPLNVPRAWGRVTSDTDTVDDGCNVTSAIANAAGYILVTLATAMANANFCVVGSAIPAGANTALFVSANAQSTTTFALWVFNASGVAAPDLQTVAYEIHFVVFGRQ